MHQQKLDTIKDSLQNPLKNRTYGGMFYGENFKTADTVQGIYAETAFEGYVLKSKKADKKQSLIIALHTDQAISLEKWQKELEKRVKTTPKPIGKVRRDTRDW